MDLLKMLAPKPSELIVMEPFQVPDWEGKTDRELLESMATDAARLRHMFEQTMIAAQSSPLLSGLLPKVQ